MFGQVLEKLDSWLGRSFLVARFFPWLLFAGANVGLAAIEFPSVNAFVRVEYGHIGASDRAIDLILSLGLIGVVAYTLSPAVHWFISLLEGNGLWSIVATPRVGGRRHQLDRRANRQKSLFRDRASLPNKEDIVIRLGEARNAGREVKTRDPEAIQRAGEEIGTLLALRQMNDPITSTRLSVTIELLREALLRNCADSFALVPPVDQDVLAATLKLARLHDQMVETILPYATDVAENRESYAYQVYDKSYAVTEIAPTRLGNDVAALRSYCYTRYGFDFDFFWPRLQMTIKDEKLIARLSSAKMQIEFSALCLGLSTVLTVSWLFVLYKYGHSLIAAGLVIVVGPALMAIFLWMVHESYSAFAELVRGTVDLSRFDLLQALRRPLPATPAQEKGAWEEVTRLLRLSEENAKATFKHPSS